MIAEPLLIWIAGAELTLVIGIALLVVGHGMWMRIAQARRRPLIQRGHEVLAAAAIGDAEPADVEWLRTLSVELQLHLCSEVAPFLRGEGQARLTALAASLGLLARAEADCRSRRWSRRLRGARMLSALGGGEAVMKPLLHDSHPTIRAQATAWAVDHAAPEVIEELLERLNDRDRLCRFTTQDALLRMGTPVAEPLARYLDRCGGADAEAGLRVAEGLAHPVLLVPVLALSRDGFPPTRARAIAVLGRLGGEAGVRALERGLADPEPKVRASAARAIGKLGHWPAAPVLARLLRDSAYPVRRESALALRRLGGPGMLLLRRSLGDRNPFAADMARQVLDLPNTVYGTVSA